MDFDHIHFRAEFTIDETKTDDFKKLIQQMARTVQETEPDTITYQFYLNNKDNTKCLVHETYTNSDAAFAHMNGLASKTYFQRFLKLQR